MSGIPKLHQSHAFLQFLAQKATNNCDQLTKDEYETYAREYAAKHKTKVAYSDFSFAKINRDGDKILSLAEIKSQEFIAQQGPKFWDQMYTQAVDSGLSDQSQTGYKTVIGKCGDNTIWEGNPDDIPGTAKGKETVQLKHSNLDYFGIFSKKTRTTDIAPNVCDLSTFYELSGAELVGYGSICDVASYMDSFKKADGAITKDDLEFAKKRLEDK
ncbi:MAG: hypothetical protein QE263_09630 [Vampirovibrionales bacterium]|nr:hypothetical protein [Vampirovibrionales bacterium]